MKLKLLIGVTIFALSCQSGTPPSDEAVDPAVESQSEAQDEMRTFKEALLAKKTLEEALDHLQPLMVSEYGVVSPGSILLASWARENLTWADVHVSKNETSYARVQKDPQAEYGKRLCAWHNIIQIEKVDDEIFAGLFLTTAGTLYYFLSVGSTGDLVRMSRGHFCGVVTGKYDYPNSGGGTGHAVEIVGIFNLPENKMRGQTPAKKK